MLGDPKARCSTTWVDPKKVFRPFPNPQNSPLGPKKVTNDPKIESKSNVRIHGAPMSYF